LHEQTSEQFHQVDIKSWDFGQLPETHQFEQAGVKVVSYPALVDMKDAVAIELKDYPEEAEQLSRRGLVRLFMLQLGPRVKSLRKELLRGNAISLQMAAISQQRDQWLDDLLYSVFSRVFLSSAKLPRDEQSFQQCLQQGRSRLQIEVNQSAQLLADIASAYAAVRKQMKKANQLAWTYAIADINYQLDALFTKGFIADVPWQWLQQYPRYLEAIARRLEKLQGHYERDRKLAPVLDKLTNQLKEHWTDNSDAAWRSKELLHYRWLLEEYRVSLFAQQLGTV
jgi:ATP-dependent helicase HrpA